MKCNYCNTEILSSFSYCPSCGKQVKDTDSKTACSSTSSASNTSTFPGVGQKRLRTFAEFQAEKGRERTTGGKPDETSRFKQKKRKRNAEVTVNIGIMAFDKKGEFKPVRSKYLMVKAWPEYNKWQLLSEAVKKHTNHDRSFTLLSNEWTLVYPDGTEVLSIPGKDDVLFTLEGYKQELCKAYNRITLYLASPNDVSTFEASRNLLNQSESDDGEDMQDMQCSESSESYNSNLDASHKIVTIQSSHTTQASTSVNDSPQQEDDCITPTTFDAQLHTLMEIFPGRDEESMRLAISSTSSLEEAIQLLTVDIEGPLHNSYANLCMEDVENDDLIMSPECCFVTEETVYYTDKALHLLLSNQVKKFASDEYTRMKVTR